MKTPRSVAWINQGTGMSSSKSGYSKGTTIVEKDRKLVLGLANLDKIRHWTLMEEGKAVSALILNCLSYSRQII